MKKVINIIKNNSHPVWVFIQQFAVRGLLGVKFLLIARLLDPKEIGIISIALISLTFTESLTEIGLMQAVVQNKKKINYPHVIWTLQFFRGLLITLILLVINNFLVAFFKEPDAKNVLLLAAFVPLVKNSISSKYYFEIRDKNFKAISIIFGLSSIIDLVGSLVLVYIFKDPIFAIVSLIVAEVVKALLTHIIFGWTIKLDFRFKLIKEILSYGRWIWANSLSSFLVNQFDKILTTTFLGTKSLGLYQMSQKMTQLAVADISFAAGQYLFPQFSFLNRDLNKNNYLKKYYSNMMLLVIIFSIILSSFVFIYAEKVIHIVFGNGWEDMTNIIRLMMISSSLAAVTNISVIYNRAIGKPKKVTIVSYTQLIIFICLCLILVHPLKVQGLVISNIISYLISLTLLNYSFKNKFLYALSSVKNNLLLLTVIISIVILMYIFKNSVSSNIGFLIGVILFGIGFCYISIKFKKSGEIQT